MKARKVWFFHCGSIEHHHQSLQKLLFEQQFPKSLWKSDISHADWLPDQSGSGNFKNVTSSNYEKQPNWNPVAWLCLHNRNDVSSCRLLLLKSSFCSFGIHTSHTQCNAATAANSIPLLQADAAQQDFITCPFLCLSEPSLTPSIVTVCSWLLVH